jgi:alpha-glucosidase (family GH31 glycosyl hydrolase)
VRVTFPQLPSRPIADPAAVLRGEHHRITVLDAGLLRLEWSDDGVFEDRASTFALNRELPVPEFRVHEGAEGRVEIVTERLHLSYDGRRFSTSGLSVQARGNVSTYHSLWRFGDPDSLSRQLGGTARTLDGADGSIPLEPGVLSANGISVLDDSGSLVFGSDGWVAARDGSRIDLYVFCFGRDYRAAIRAFYAVSGLPPLLPRWALGNWWSRYHPYTSDEYRRLMDRFGYAGVPLSVAVLDMDWHEVDIDPALGSGWTGYTWNRALIPDPPAFLAELHETGLRVTLNDHPADGIRPHEKAYAEVARALDRDPAAGDPIPFDVTDPAFLRVYFDVLHRGLEHDGVDFWWIDWQSGPYSRIAGIDPLWMLNHYTYLDNARSGRRPLVLSRYAGPGSHRYPVGFSGDTVVSWASLDFQPAFTATASNIGYGWWSHDIGGHFGGVKDDELATRWVQLGAFSPVLRLHSGSNPFATKEPWAFRDEARDAMTKFLRLRHRMLPYLHSMNHRAAAGEPLVQPLYWSYPDAPEAYRVPHQFTFGTELMIAPLTRPRHPALRTAAVTAWLPPGEWTDLLTGLHYAGDRLLRLHRTLAVIPVLARAGAVIPLDRAEIPGFGVGNPLALEVLVVPGADGGFEMVEDDDTAAPAVARTPMRWDQAAGELVIGPATGDLSVIPSERSWTVSLIGADAAGLRPDVRVDGTPVEVSNFEERQRFSVIIGDVPAAAQLRVGFGRPPASATTDVTGRVFALLDLAEIEYETKRIVQQVATADQPVGVRVSHLQALGLDRELESAVCEILLA